MENGPFEDVFPIENGYDYDLCKSWQLFKATVLNGPTSCFLHNFWLRLFLRRVRCKRSQGDIDVNIDVSWIIMASLFLDEQCS